MHNLTQLTEQVKEEFADLRSYVVPTEDVRMTDAGRLSTGKNEFPVTPDGYDSLAENADIPKPFFQKLPTDLEAMLFNRCFAKRLSDKRLPHDIRINLNKDRWVVGFDDPHLLRISPVKLMEKMVSSLPDGLPAEKIEVATYTSSSKRLQISCFSPKIIAEPRAGDFINGGVDVVHNLAGNSGTQVSCYLRRMVCSNGAITHVCGEDGQLRARRLHDGRFDEDDMLAQIHRLLIEAWSQLQEKLDVVRGLLNRERVSMDFFRQQRTKFSLNNRIFKAIDQALRADELGTTNSQYDIFNALSRVATQETGLTFRQYRTLSRMAGELSQQTVHKCDKCGNWVVQEDPADAQ